jgi:hypothetical protein
MFKKGTLVRECVSKTVVNISQQKLRVRQDMHAMAFPHFKKNGAMDTSEKKTFRIYIYIYSYLYIYIQNIFHIWLRYAQVNCGLWSIYQSNGVNITQNARQVTVHRSTHRASPLARRHGDFGYRGWAMWWLIPLMIYP